jgi:hypothetical protein
MTTVVKKSIIPSIKIHPMKTIVIDPSPAVTTNSVTTTPTTTATTATTVTGTTVTAFASASVPASVPVSVPVPVSASAPVSAPVATIGATGATTISMPKISPSLKQIPLLVPRARTKEVRISLPSLTEVYGAIYTEIHKKIIETLGEVLEKIGEDYKLNSDELKNKYLRELRVMMDKNEEEIKKVSAGTNTKKVKPALEPQFRCMARTATGEQCTRRRQINNGYEYCGSHYAIQPYGRIDEEKAADEPPVEKKKRGRPPKATASGVVPADLESPYDDTERSLDFMRIQDGEQDYICNKKTNIVYETPESENINSIADLTRVGMWDSDKRSISYDIF